jgi:hypothetical protein
MPAKNRVRSDECRELVQQATAKALATHGETPPLLVVES